MKKLLLILFPVLLLACGGGNSNSSKSGNTNNSETPEQKAKTWIEENVFADMDDLKITSSATEEIAYTPKEIVLRKNNLIETDDQEYSSLKKEINTVEEDFINSILSGTDNAEIEKVESEMERIWQLISYKDVLLKSTGRAYDKISKPTNSDFITMVQTGDKIAESGNDFIAVTVEFSGSISKGQPISYTVVMDAKSHEIHNAPVKQKTETEDGKTKIRYSL